MRLNCGRVSWLSPSGVALLVAVLFSIGRAEEDFSEPEAEDFAYPVPWLKTGPAKQRMLFASHRNLMLKNGWEGSPAKALTAAKVEYDAARKLCPDDPRIEYAYGLALWKYDKRSEAIKQFDAAARMNGKQPPFLPAAQAAAWGRLMDGQHDAGLKQIVTVATVLSKTKGDYPTLIQKSDSALFLGRAVEFLSGPGSAPETADSDKKLLDEVASLIPVDLKDEFQSGRNQIDERHAELKALAARPADEVEAEHRQKKEEIEKQLTDCRNETKRINDEIETDGREQKEWLKQTMKKIGQLERDLAQIQRELPSVSAAVSHYSSPKKHYETRERRVKKKDEDGRTYYDYEKETVERPETPSEQSARQANLSRARAYGNVLLQRQAAASDELNSLKAERRTSNSDFQKSQAARRHDRGKQFRVQRDLAVKMKQLEQDYVSPEELQARVDTIAPYVPWDPDLEREALLASYRVTLPESLSP